MTTPVDKTLTVKSAVDKICNSNQNHMLINNNTQRFKYIFCDFNADIKYSDDIIYNVMKRKNKVLSQLCQIHGFLTNEYHKIQQIEI